jgi:hypothetical protein
MPTSDYDYWRNQVGGWQGIDPIILEGMQFDEGSEAMMNRLLSDTHAEQFLSPWTIRRYKNYSAMPFLESEMMNMGAGRVPNDTMSGNTLKDWILRPGANGQQGNGFGNYSPSDWKQKVNSVIGNANYTGTDEGSAPYQISAYLKQNPELLAAMMSLGIGSAPYGQFLKGQLNDKMDVMGTHMEGDWANMGAQNWIDWLIKTWGGGYSNPFGGANAGSNPNQQFRGSQY